MMTYSFLRSLPIFHTFLLLFWLEFKLFLCIFQRTTVTNRSQFEFGKCQDWQNKDPTGTFNPVTHSQWKSNLALGKILLYFFFSNLKIFINFSTVFYGYILYRLFFSYFSLLIYLKSRFFYVFFNPLFEILLWWFFRSTQTWKLTSI